MSSENFDPRLRAVELFCQSHEIDLSAAPVLLEAIDRAKDREIARLRKIIDEGKLCRCD